MLQVRYRFPYHPMSFHDGIEKTLSHQGSLQSVSGYEYKPRIFNVQLEWIILFAQEIYGEVT
jgi:hypothetical protein